MRQEVDIRYVVRCGNEHTQGQGAREWPPHDFTKSPFDFAGAPEKIRTSDLRLRRQNVGRGAQ